VKTAKSLSAHVPNSAERGLATQIVIAGNVAEDRVPGGWKPGGPALYSALAAHALGADVQLITRLTPGYNRAIFAGIELRAFPAVNAPRYANSYDKAGNRAQLLLHGGEPLEPYMLVSDRHADGFILAPAYHEVTGWPPPCARVQAVSLQGFLRSTNDQNQVTARLHPAEIAAQYARRGVIGFLSEEDTQDAESLARSFAATPGAMAIVTRGYQGALVFESGKRTEHAALSAEPIDPTGAGDCFSTAYVVRLAETRDHGQAIRFALAAGALAVEGEGIAGIPTRAAIERRLEMVAA
jgi:hypothetical protein